MFIVGCTLIFLAISYGANSQPTPTVYADSDSVRISKQDGNEHHRNFVDSQYLRKANESLREELKFKSGRLYSQDSLIIAQIARLQAQEQLVTRLEEQIQVDRKELKGTKVWGRLGVVGIVGAFVLGIVIGK